MDEIFEYYTENASLNVAVNLIRGLAKETDILADNAYVGQIETDLSERKEAYRYLVYKSYKILYTIHEPGQSVQIADVYDTRQNQ